MASLRITLLDLLNKSEQGADPNFLRDGVVEVMNALLLPVALGFLFLLAVRALPAPFRLRRSYAALAAFLILIKSAFGFFAAISGIASR